MPRLLDLGVEPYLITSTVNVAIGQRLVRKICDGCKSTRALNAGEKKSLAETEGLPKADFTQISFGKGCDDCVGTGYRGRIGIYEVLALDEPIRQAMLRRDSANVIKELAIKQGMNTMIEDGFRKIKQGGTTIEEVLRVIHE